MFSVTDVSLEKNTKVNHLWVVALDPTHAGKAVMNGAPGSGVERQVTFGAGESFGRFSPDGKWVSMTAGDNVWLAPWDEAAGTVGTAKQLTRVSGGGADGAVWSPDSKRLMFVADVWPGCSVKGSDPTRDGGAVTNGAPGGGGGTSAGALRSAQNDSGLGGGGGTPYFVVGGTREVLNPTRDGGAVTNGAPSSWAEEDACDKARDAAVAGSAVKGQVWDGLLYRHWDHFTGAKRSHVLVVNADGSGVRDLTPASVVGDAETPTFSLGGPLGYAWAPDSKEIAYVTNLDAVPAASTNNDVFTLRLDEAGAKAVKVSTSPGSDDGPAYSPDGKWLAWRSQARGGFESDKFRLMLFDRGTKTIKDLMPKLNNWVDEFVWVPDSSAIVFASGAEGMEQISSYGVLPDEKPGDHPVSAGITAQGEYGELSVAQKGDDVLIVATKMTVSAPAEVVTINAGMLGHTFYDITEMDRRMAKEMGINYVDPKVSGKLIEEEQVSPEGERQLTHLNQPLLGSLALAPLNYFWFTGAEGTKVQAFLIKPPGFDPAKKYPVKFLMHGGPQTAWGDAWSYRWNWELMAASGYVVVGINRRGSTGYGQKFVDEVSGDWGGRAYVDLMKGLDYAEAHYSFIDKTRECALGASYGGFMADWVLTHTNRFQCIVTHDGMYDPVAAYGATEEMWFNEWEFRRPEDFPKGWDGLSGGYDPMGHPQPTHDEKANMSGAPARKSPEREGQMGALGRVAGPSTTAAAGASASAQDDGEKGGRDVDGHPAEPWRYQNLPADKDPFRRWSPMRFIENANTPTLVIHSQKDMRLDVSQGMELFTALQRLGVPSKMLYFPDEGHWILKPQNAEVWNEVVGDWCDRWTKTGKYAVGQGTEGQGTGNREQEVGNRE
jgi:dipeptidyl aminopeptidase/acylaminoacyl peptidase